MALKLSIHVNRNHSSLSLSEGAIELGCKHKLSLFLWVEGRELRDGVALRGQLIFRLVNCLLAHAQGFHKIDKLRPVHMVLILPNFIRF
jgi:hypothetical protein